MIAQDDATGNAAKIWQRLSRRRSLALALTALLILAAGFAITLIPDSSQETPPLSAAPEPPPPAANAGAPMAQLPGDPREVDLRFKQAVIMLHAKQYDHAVAALHRVLALAPTMPEAHVNMGYAMIGLKRYDVARDFFRSAIALRPNQANAHYGLAEALAGMNDRASAIVAMQTYLRLAPVGDPFVAKANAAIAAWRKK